MNLNNPNQSENEKMIEYEFYPNFEENEAEIKHDQTEFLDKKINFTFDVLYGLIQQLAMGEKPPDLQTVSTKHQTGMLNKFQMLANLSQNYNHNHNLNQNLMSKRETTKKLKSSV
eukprot:Mrub_02751.p4 GENE.Mrub_02751~~Mrub_02751.p4  ORF type:complete len:115 (-),score=28.90 Mrub_02751:837-1181(-)